MREFIYVIGYRADVDAYSHLIPKGAEIVIPVHSKEQLQGLSHGTTVVVANFSTRAKDCDELLQLAKLRGMKIKDV